MNTSRKFVGMLTLILAIAAPMRAQVGVPLAPEQPSRGKSYPVAGSDLLWKQNQQVVEYLKQHPDEFSRMKLSKATAWNFTVGAAHAWYSIDITSGSYYQVPSTCRAVGDNCYIFVEDASWGTLVSQANVDSVRNAFDLRTPANPSKGIYHMDVDAFGNPPDVDNDPKIVILILDIADGYSGSGGYVAGYFNSLNETIQAGSNRAEIYYVDCSPTNLSTALGLEVAMETTAHEFQHMIHFNYIPSQVTFLNEGCSMVAEVNCGYPIFDQSGFITEPNHDLMDWRHNDNTAVLRDYSRATRFTTYLRDQFTMSFFTKLLQTRTAGEPGINAVLSSIGSPLHLGDVVQNWCIANILDDRSVDTAYGYRYPNLPKVIPQMSFNPNVPSASHTVQSLASDYLSFALGTNLHATVSIPAGVTLNTKAVEIGPSGNRVVDVPSGTDFSEPGFGSTYKSITFVTYNRGSFPQNYNFQSTGTASGGMELKWEAVEPRGYLLLSTNDTVTVLFDGIPGATLDSVRVALRRAGSITGGVYSVNTAAASPLGTPLSGPITATVTGTPPIPYPVPWPNWATINLSSSTTPIKVDNPFAVAFAIGSDPKTPGVMVAPYPGTSAYHSYTFVNSPSSGAPRWLYFSTTQGDSVWLYLVHAYVSFKTTGVKQTVELLPTELRLLQNYPNPFNPSTTIRYTIPSSERVVVKIYNALGQAVQTLVDAQQSTGVHELRFDASGLPSGMYFYQVEAGNEVQVKKLVLLK